MVARVPNGPRFLAALLLFPVALQPANCPAQQLDDSVVRDALEAAAAAMLAGKPAKALAALESVDAIEPQNPWLWFYRGSARALEGYPHKAIDAFDRTLDALATLGDPDPPFAARIRADRQAVRRQVTHVSVQLGLAYDSNVTFGGGGNTGLFISGRGDGKFASRVAWDYATIATPEERVTIGGRVSNAWHFSVAEFNFQDYGAFVRRTKALDDHWTLALQYDYDITYLGNQPFLSNHALSPSLIYRWESTGGRLEFRETTFEYRIESRDFLFDTTPEFDRDGVANSLGITQTFQIRPTEDASFVWDLYAGYRLQFVATEGSEFDRTTNSIYVGAAIPVENPWMPNNDTLLQLSASWEFNDYRHGSLIDRAGRERRDVITTVGVVLSQSLRADPDRGDLILHLIFNWTDSDANVRASDHSAPFNYDKVVTGFQLEWRF